MGKYKQVITTWIENDRFEKVKNYFELLCLKYELPVPEIIQSIYINGDECDYTSEKLIRLYCKEDLWGCLPPYKEHALHVFGHYLCNMEQTIYSEKIVRIITEGLKEKCYIK